MYKDFKFWNKINLKETVLKKDFQLNKPNILQAVRPLRGKYCADACVKLNARTAPVAFAPRSVSHVIFLISLVLKQTSEDSIGNTEHSYIMWTMSAIVNNFCTLADQNGVQ